MPFQSSRAKKSVKKDAGKRLSTGSIFSHASQPASKDSSKTSLEKSKRETSEKTLAASKLQRKSTGSEKKAADVFEFLDDDDDSSSSEDDCSLDNTSSQATSVSKGHTKPMHSVPGHYPSSQTYRDHLRGSQKANHPSRRSSVMSKESTDSRLPPLDISSVATQLQIAKSNVRKPSLENLYVPAGFPTDGSAPTGKEALDFSPESYYSHPRSNNHIHRPPLPPSPPKSPKEDAHQKHRKPRRNTKSSYTPSGYGFIASHLSSESEHGTHIPPLYRRFEALNHRVLLHLQDEIAQMEEDLQVLDDYEEMNRVTTAEHEGTKVLPASRRMDAQAQVYSSLHFRRMDLLGQLAQKIEQYNNALSAYNKALRNLPPASERDIETYRTWMDKKAPIAAAEARFLDHHNDLVSLSPPPALTSPTAPIYAAIVIASAAILFPLLAFSMIREFLGRLVLVAVVGGAASAIASNYPTMGEESLIDARDGWRCATMYFGFMTIAAMFIP